MSRSPQVLAAAFLIAALPAAPSAHAAESYDNCAFFITSLPVTITSQGVWCMNADKSASLASGAAVTIDANNVTIDCNGYKLGNLSAGASNAADGIRTYNRNNATIRNCNVRGYFQGIHLIGSGHLVEDTRVEASGYAGIRTQGDGTVIRRNTVLDTGTGVHSPYAAILASGLVDVIDNIVTGVAATATTEGGAIGIFVSPLLGGRVEGNAVRGLVADGAGTAYGIFIDNSGGGVSISRNRVANGGTASGNGIQCAGAPASLLTDNHAIGFSGGWSGGCTDVGLNYSQ
jgi:hypothetical protein